MLAQMDEAVTTSAADEAEAATAIARMREMSADLRGCAILRGLAVASADGVGGG